MLRVRSLFKTMSGERVCVKGEVTIQDNVVREVKREGMC